MTQLVKAGTTSFRGYVVRILDASTGAPYTGATSATAGASFGYTRPGGTRQSIALSDLAAVDSAFSAGGIKHIANGKYRLDLPDAALATGVNSVTIDGGFTSYVVVCEAIELLAVDIFDAIRMGLSALPNAAAAASGGVPVIGSAPLTYLTGDAYARLGAPVGASHAADVANVAADVTTLLGRLSAARAGYLDNLSAGAVATASALATLAGKFTGITLLSEWLGALAGKQTPNATALTEIKATGAGSGTYDATTDSQEALRDRGDAAWTTGSSVLGSGSESVRIRCLNGAAPVDGAAVWITTDSAGTNVVAGTVYTSGTGYTSTLMLDPGTYYVWRQANGVNFTNPETITVSDL